MLLIASTLRPSREAALLPPLFCLSRPMRVVMIPPGTVRGQINHTIDKQTGWSGDSSSPASNHSAWGHSPNLGASTHKMFNSNSGGGGEASSHGSNSTNHMFIGLLDIFG